MAHAHDPKKIGPGSWTALHILSTKSDSAGFMVFCKYLKDDFPCLTCRNAINEYMELDSPFDLKTETDSTGKDISRAKWSWIFHNSVNQKLDKDIFSWDSFQETYFDATCSLDCGDDITENRIAGSVGDKKAEEPKVTKFTSIA